MIVKIQRCGKSFKGLAAYLTHDVKAETAERVAWTHTLNLAHDHIPSAVDEMLWTSRYAEILKQEAGLRAGGRSTENAVKSVSLNWAPDQQPERDHMIEASEGFLRHMGWAEHQTVIVAHQDKHPHVHLMVNVVHPETGLRLDDNFERRRAQAWALEYEKSQGRIYCEQRLADPSEREDAPTRPAWRAFDEQQREFQQAEITRDNAFARAGELSADAPDPQAEEWKTLKAMLADERKSFMAQGKMAFSELRNAVYREVREEFRERWSEYYDLRKSGEADAETLAGLKATLTAEQKEALAERRDEACAVLRESRNIAYRELLDEQRDLRLGLRWRQEAGLENDLFLDMARDRHLERGQAATFYEVATALTTPPEPSSEFQSPFTYALREPSDGMRSGVDIGAGIGFGLLALFGGLADSFSGGTAATPPRRDPVPEPRPDWTQAAIDEGRQRQQREQEEADEERRRRQRASSWE